MPIVPTSRQGTMRVVDPTEGINPTNLAMAAAMMHSEGKLFKPREREIESEASMKDKA